MLQQWVSSHSLVKRVYVCVRACVRVFIERERVKERENIYI